MIDERREREIIVRYEREGQIYYDEYYYIRLSTIEAIEDVKSDWHRHNDPLFAEATDAKFYSRI